MAGLLAVLYGVGSYAVFLVSFLYAVGFVGNLAVPKSIDSGAAGPLIEILMIDAMLLGLFAIQHSVMARPGFKRWWTRLVPTSVERSTYVLFASLVLLMLYWQWRPIAEPVWTVREAARRAAAARDLLVRLGHAAGQHLPDQPLRAVRAEQVFARLLGREPSAAEFHTPLLYRHVRHPIYLGFLLAFWATPTMTAGHLLFALATTGYILIAIQLEERDLIGLFGDRYRRYRQQRRDAHSVAWSPSAQPTGRTSLVGGAQPALNDAAVQVTGRQPEVAAGGQALPDHRTAFSTRRSGTSHISATST